MPDTENAFDGSAEAVVQAGEVHGGVHFHGPRPVSARVQIRPPSPHFTNNRRQLDEASNVAERLDEGAGPEVIVFRSPPGGGKSETACKWIDMHRDMFPDGLFYARLAGRTGHAGTESNFLREWLLATGHQAEAIPETLEGRSAWFRSWSTRRRIGVLVDDAVSAAQVRRLLPGPGRSVVLATEAGPLGGLAAKERVTFVDITPLADESARLLLGRIAGTERIEAEPDAVDILIGICAGSALALCVVGSMLAESPRRPVSRFARELADERRRLAALSRDEDLSVTTVLNTALQRLGERARQCYLALGQHPGALEASVPALAHATGCTDEDTRDAMDELAGVRLVWESGEGRYSWDDLVRLHASEPATRDPHTDTGLMRVRFGEYYARRALAAGYAAMPNRGWIGLLWPDVEIDEWPAEDGDPLLWLERERPVLRALTERDHEEGELRRLCLLAVALWPLHERYKYIEDMIAVNELAVEAATHIPDRAAESVLRFQCGFGYRHRGDAETAHRLFASAVEPARAARYRELEATTVESMGLARLDQQRISDARELLRQSLQLALDIGAEARIAVARMHAAKVEEPERALELLDDALTGFRALSPPDELNAGKVLLLRGTILANLGHFTEAERVLTEAVDVLDGYPFDRARALEELADVHRDAGNAELARSVRQEAVELYTAHGFSVRAESARTEMDGG